MSQNSIKLVETTLAAGKPVALVCHAPSVLHHAKTQEKTPLVQGKTSLASPTPKKMRSA